MELCPETLEIRLTDPNVIAPTWLFQNRVLNLRALFPEFIRAVGKALATVTSDGGGSFQAENGVKIEADFTLCHRVECMEDDGCQKIFKYVSTIHTR